jgi:hypothetical protein
MDTKRIYGTSVKKINGKTINRLEYDGDSDGENMVINVLQNGRRKRIIVPEHIESQQQFQSYVLPRMFYKKPTINEVVISSDEEKYTDTRKAKPLSIRIHRPVIASRRIRPRVRARSARARARSARARSARARSARARSARARSARARSARARGSNNSPRTRSRRANSRRANSRRANSRRANSRRAKGTGKCSAI